MRNAIITSLIILMSGCSSGLLAPDRERQMEFLEATSVKASTAYQLSLRWFDKNLRYVSGASRLQEADSGHVKLEAAYLCNAFRKDNDLKDYYLTFELDFQAAPKHIALHFTQLRMENAEGNLVPKPEAQLSSGENVNRIRPCLKKMVAALAKAVESNTLTW